MSRAIIVNSDGKILLVKRAETHKNNPNKWEIPGGKVDKGECHVTALRREIHEELGVEISVSTLRTHLVYRVMRGDKQEGHRYTGMTFLAELPACAKLELSSEHCKGPVWCTPREALAYDLTRESRLAITTLFPS